MKKSLKYILSILICLLLIGSGFAIWFFNEAGKQGAITGGVSVTDESTLTTTLKIRDTSAAPNVYLWDSASDTGTKDLTGYAITLDQGTNPTDLTQLIYFGEDNTKTQLNLVFTVTITGYADKLDTVNLTTSVTLTPKLEEYITATFVATTGVEGIDVNGMKSSKSGDTKTIEVYKTLSFQYNTGKKPSTSAAYNTMKTDLNGTSQKFTINANIA